MANRVRGKREKTYIFSKKLKIFEKKSLPLEIFLENRKKSLIVFFIRPKITFSK